MSFELFVANTHAISKTAHVLGEMAGEVVRTLLWDFGGWKVVCSPNDGPGT